MTPRAAPVLLVLGAVLTTALAVGVAHLDRPLLVHDIATPPFVAAPRPPLAESFTVIEAHLHRPAGRQWLRELAPNQGGALWIALLVVIAVAGFDSGLTPRVRDLLVAQLPAWLLFGSLDIFEQSQAPAFLGWVQFLFELAALVTAVIWARTFWLQRRPYLTGWTPVLRRGSLRALTLTLVALNLCVIFLDPSDDSSFFANLGGQRLRERGWLVQAIRC